MFTLVVGLWLPATPVQAAGAEFSVAAAPTTGYFDLTLHPGSTKALAVTINNTANAPRRFTVAMVPATTDASGQLLYTAHAKLTAAGKPTLTTWTPVSRKQVTVAAHGRQQVTLRLAIPNSATPGERLGAIAVTTHRAFAAKRQASIQNRFTLATPVHVTIDHPLTARPRLTLTHARVASNHRQLTATLASHTARLFGQITLRLALVDATGKQLLHTTLHNAQMAPGARMPLALPLGSRPLKPGKYWLRVRLASGSQHYDLRQPLTITANAAYASAKPPFRTAPLPWWVFALIAAVVALTLAVLGLLITRRRRS